MSQRTITLLAMNLIGLLIAQVLLLIILIQPTRPAPPVIEWTDSNYVPGEFCPGDLVSEMVTVKGKDSAVVVVFSTFLRFGPDGDNILFQRLGDAAAVIIPSPRILKDQDPTWKVPDLPPGDYVRAIAAGTIFRYTEPIFREQEFSIRSDCAISSRDE